VTPIIKRVAPPSRIHSEATKRGLEAARARGVRFGPRVKISPDEARAEVQSGKSLQQIAQCFGVTVATVRRALGMSRNPSLSMARRRANNRDRISAALAALPVATCVCGSSFRPREFTQACCSQRCLRRSTSPRPSRPSPSARNSGWKRGTPRANTDRR